MPYINNDLRSDIANGIDLPSNAGEANYLLTLELHKLVNNYGLSYETIFNIKYGIRLVQCIIPQLWRMWGNNHMATLPMKDEEITVILLNTMKNLCDVLFKIRHLSTNDLYFIELLEQVKEEFTRRVVNPYEDLKIKENGDIDITVIKWENL